MKNDMLLSRSFGTHDGSFHADEVTACALLIIFDLIDLKKVVRTRDLKRLECCEYVCDVGGIYNSKVKRFDHHQSDYTGMYSSAGMVLLYLKTEKILGDKLYGYLNRSLIMGVDAIDNGRVNLMVGHTSFSSVIANFVPIRHDSDPEEFHKSFFQALDFTIDHLKRLIARFHYIQECFDEIKEEMDKEEKIMIFERSMPWVETFFELGGVTHPAQFIIMPAGNQWKLRGIPPTYEKRMKVRVLLPESWAGLIDEELKKETQISGAVFCHKGRFISIWESKEDALKAYQYMMKKKGKR